MKKSTKNCLKRVLIGYLFVLSVFIFTRYLELGKIIKNNLDSKKDLKFDEYSKELARELGLERYYDYVYTADDNYTIPKSFKSIEEFRQKSSELYTNTGKYAISRYRKVEKTDGINHYMLVRGNPWNDEVDPGRGIIKYKLVDVLPLRSCILPGVKK